ncbi:YdcH family protein [Arcobacter sp. 15-2]|uniref:YdcH family protein n=1 Tax=Arcobacter sp. 15-2 TaxID=3374109 RepID=UPI00399CE4D6
MFHEHREIVTELKTSNAHFKKIFDAHNDLHDQLEKAEEGGVDHINPMEIEKMKKEKLKLKDEAYAMIMDYKNK